MFLAFALVPNVLSTTMDLSIVREDEQELQKPPSVMGVWFPGRGRGEACMATPASFVALLSGPRRS